MFKYVSNAMDCNRCICLSINKPNKAVPIAVEKTMSAVVKALIEPIYLTP